MSVEDELAFLMKQSKEELFAIVGKHFNDLATAILDEVLARHGALSPLVDDGTSHPLTEYISESEIPVVLAEARQLAKERKLPTGKDGDLSLVKTDDDAVAYILGLPDDEAA